MKENRRQDRLAQFIRKELGSMLLTEGHGDALSRIVLTDCRVTADLRQARIYFTILGDEDHDGARARAEEALARSRGHLRHRLGQLMHAKHTPDLTFFYDETLDQARRIEALIDRLPHAEPDGTEGDKE